MSTDKIEQATTMREVHLHGLMQKANEMTEGQTMWVDDLLVNYAFKHIHGIPIPEMSISIPPAFGVHPYDPFDIQLWNFCMINGLTATYIVVQYGWRFEKDINRRGHIVIDSKE